MKNEQAILQGCAGLSVIFSQDEVQAVLRGVKTQFRRPLKPQPDLSILKNPAIDLVWRRCPALGPTHIPAEWGMFNREASAGSVPIYGYKCPYGEIGDELWVKETWALIYQRSDCCVRHDDDLYKCPCDDCYVEYRADTSNPCPAGWTRDMARDEFDEAPRWKSPVHMKRNTSRLLLKIANIRVERLQDISDEDAGAEGCDSNLAKKLAGGNDMEDPDSGLEFLYIVSPKSAFSVWWNSVHGKSGAYWEDNPWVWTIDFTLIKNVNPYPKRHLKRPKGITFTEVIFLDEEE